MLVSSGVYQQSSHWLPMHSLRCAGSVGLSAFRTGTAACSYALQQPTNSVSVADGHQQVLGRVTALSCLRQYAIETAY